MGLIIPVEITVYKDRSFDFILKSPPAAVLLKKAAGLEKARRHRRPRDRAGRSRAPRSRRSRKMKMDDLNARDARGGLPHHRGHGALVRDRGRRLRSEDHGQAQQEVSATPSRSVDRSRTYDPHEALALLKELPGAKFDETVELAVRLGIDPRKSDQLVRGAVSLPKGLGKTVKVIVFAEGDKAEAAEAAGADEVGSAELAEQDQRRLDRLRRRASPART